MNGAPLYNTPLYIRRRYLAGEIDGRVNLTMGRRFMANFLLMALRVYDPRVDYSLGTDKQNASRDLFGFNLSVFLQRGVVWV